MKMEVAIALLLVLGMVNCETVITLRGRPLLGGEAKTITKVLKHELKVDASADAVWSVYSSPNLAKHLPDLLPGAFAKLEIIGDGGVGTVLDMTFPPGEFPHEYKEKFVLIDNERRLKMVQMIEGGYLDLGVTYYMDTISVVATSPDSCVIKSSTEYHVKPEFANVVEPLISTGPLAAMAEAIAKIVLQNKHECGSEQLLSITS